MKLIFGLFFCAINCLSQSLYPKDYFRSPLDISLNISGNFGELRPNHFHAGLDFRTQQKEGLNVYAAASGYVSRIKISTFGYGKAIYITHPNGFTSVYGHLKNANPEIEQFVKTQQYKEKSFEIDIFPKATDLLVQNGDFIALSGNTGGSGGPHLHFEIRETATEKPINPMHFGFDKDLVDTRLPNINGLIVYPISDMSGVNDSQKPVLINLVLQKDGTYTSEKIRANGKIGFGINAHDLMDYSYIRNGLYKVESFLNGQKSFGYQFDTFSFEEAKQINALIDYPRYKNSGARYQKLFALNPYNLSIIDKDNNNGIINVTPNLTQVYRIELSDFNNNKVTINIPIVHSLQTPKVLKNIVKTNYFLKSKIENIYSEQNVTVTVPPNAFYEDFYLNFNVKNDTLTFQDENIAQQNSILVVFDKEISIKDKLKTFIATIDGNKLIYNKTKIKDFSVSCYTKNLGKMIIAKDVVAPTITAINVTNAKNLDAQTTIQFSINDSLSGIKDYNGYINEKWILFEYDFKTKKIIHKLSDGIFLDGKNDLKLEVTDNVGNTTIFEAQFFKKK